MKLKMSLFDKESFTTQRCWTGCSFLDVPFGGNVSFVNSWVKCGIFKTATAQNRPNIELARVRKCTFCRMAWWFKLISKITIIHLKHSFQNYKVYGVIWMFRFWVVIGDSSWKGDCIDFEWSSRGLMYSFGTPPNRTQHVRLIGEAGKKIWKTYGGSEVDMLYGLYGCFQK